MKKFENRSFRTKLLINFLLIGVVPLIAAAALMLGIFQASLRQSAENTARTQVDAMSRDLTKQLTSCQQVMERLREDEQIGSALRQTGTVSQSVYYTLYDTAGPQLASAAFSIYSREGDMICSTASRSASQQLSTAWGLLKDARDTEGAVFRDAAKGEPSRLQAACAIREPGCAEVLGYVVLDMSDQHFQRLFDGKYSEGNDVLVLDRFWSEVYSSPAIRDTGLAQTLRARLLSGQPLNGGAYSFFLGQDSLAGLCLVLRQPLPLGERSLQLLYVVTVISILLSLCLCALVSMRVSRQLFEPIRALNSAMASVEQGDLSVRLEPHSADELGQLTGRFNRMTERLEENLAQSLRQQKELNETQVRMMQAQLNPHFLYNTLDTLKWLGKINHIPEVATISADLADILRSSISGGEFVTMDQELKLVERYMEIQRIRFSGKFQVTIQTPPELRDVLVPKLMLQPLVENAIIHGFEGREGGEITISAAAQRELLVVDVRDNGRGMPKDGPPDLRNADGLRSGRHLGLYNVDAILRLHYGPEYGLRFPPVAGPGACVRITLPITREESLPC